MIAKTQYQLSADDTLVVLALARAGTLAAAGHVLSADGSTVFRTLARIERGLQQRLFERSRVGYRPTELGQALAGSGERLEAALDVARNVANTSASSVSGIVRISTTDTLLHGLVLPALQGLANAHPQLQLELTASNELASLTRRDADIALRATKKPPDHLIGRSLGTIRAALYAPSAWVGKSKSKTRQDALLQGPWVAPDDALPDHPSVRWRKRHHPRAVANIRVNSIVSVMEAVASGLGIGVVPLFLARGRKDISALSPPLEECETQLWLLTHPESRHLRRIALVAEHLMQHMQLG